MTRFLTTKPSMTRRKVLTGIAGAALGICISGCGMYRKHTPAAYVCAIDISPSNQNGRVAQIDALDQILMQAIGDHKELSVWVFDKQPLRIYQNIPTQPSELDDLKRQYLRPIAAGDHSHDGTCPGKLFEEIVNDLHVSREKVLRCLVLTDGDEDDPKTDAPLFAQTAAVLASRANVQVAVGGLDPNNHVAWETAFKPANNRVTFRGVGKEADATSDLY